MAEKKENISNKQILFCNCKSERIDPELIQKLTHYLEAKKSKFIMMTDLCGLAATDKELLSDLIKDDTRYLVTGCFPRTMNLLFRKVNNDFDVSTGMHFVNLFEDTFESICEQIDSFSDEPGEEGTSGNLEASSEWPSWYPVIDYERCTSCGQCADFCLFGVYEKSASEVKVVNPQGCKYNCPACARICPATAIIFPKYKNGGAIGGSDSIDEQMEQKRQTMDIESLLGDDIYAALIQRKMKRQSIIREEAMKRAVEERDNALKKK